MIEDDPKRLRDLIILSTHFSEVRDLDVLMERILRSARGKRPSLRSAVLKAFFTVEKEMAEIYDRISD